MIYPTEPQNTVRPWGSYDVLHHGLHSWTKILYINPGQRLSLQVHNYRTEVWLPLDSGARAEIAGQTLDLQPAMQYTVVTGTSHRIYNPTDWQVRILEVATGTPRERDIIRLDDDYGRGLDR